MRWLTLVLCPQRWCTVTAGDVRSLSVTRVICCCGSSRVSLRFVTHVMAGLEPGCPVRLYSLTVRSVGFLAQILWKCTKRYKKLLEDRTWGTSQSTFVLSQSTTQTIRHKYLLASSWKTIPCTVSHGVDRINFNPYYNFWLPYIIFENPYNFNGKITGACFN